MQNRNTKKITILTYRGGGVKASPYNRPRRPRGGVEI